MTPIKKPVWADGVYGLEVYDRNGELLCVVHAGSLTPEIIRCINGYPDLKAGYEKAVAALYYYAAPGYSGKDRAVNTLKDLGELDEDRDSEVETERSDSGSGETPNPEHSAQEGTESPDHGVGEKDRFDDKVRESDSETVCEYDNLFAVDGVDTTLAEGIVCAYGDCNKDIGDDGRHCGYHEKMLSQGTQDAAEADDGE